MAQTQQPKNLEEALKVIQQLTKMIEHQNQLIEQMNVALQLQQHRRFSKKNEAMNPDQLSLFEDESAKITVEDPSNDEVKEESVSRHPKRKKKHVRQEKLDSLPQKDCEYDLKNKTCPDCEQPLENIGRKLISREPVVIPAQFFCKNTYAKVYKCRHCHPNGGDKLVTAGTPSPLFNHSYVSSSVLANIATNKFDLAIPFNRQERIWKAASLELNSKQMANAVIKGADRFLKPLYNLLCDQLRQEKVVHMDETPFQVLDSGKSRSYFWVVRTPKEFANHQIALFHYAPTRSGKVISDVLTSDYSGAVMCDGYGGYSQERLPESIFGSCLIHIRRLFIELVKGLKLKDDAPATKAVKLLSRVFHCENNLQYQTPAEKKAQRQKLVKPLLDAFYTFIEGISNPMHRLRNAIKNAVKLKSRVYQIFEICELPLSNNAVEQSIRPSTIIRKNSLFAKSTAGAKANAIFYTIVQTAKLNNLNVFKYLELIFEAHTRSQNPDLKAYLPWNPMVRQLCGN